MCWSARGLSRHSLDSMEPDKDCALQTKIVLCFGPSVGLRPLHGPVPILEGRGFTNRLKIRNIRTCANPELNLAPIEFSSLSGFGCAKIIPHPHRHLGFDFRRSFSEFSIQPRVTCFMCFTVHTSDLDSEEWAKPRPRPQYPLHCLSIPCKRHFPPFNSIFCNFRIPPSCVHPGCCPCVHLTSVRRIPAFNLRKWLRKWSGGDCKRPLQTHF